MSKSALSVGYALVSPFTCAIQIDGSGSRERFLSTIDLAMTRLVEVHGYARAEMMDAPDEVVTRNPTSSVGSCGDVHYASITIPATMSPEELTNWLPVIRECAVDLFERVSELTARAARVHALIEAEARHG